MIGQGGLNTPIHYRRNLRTDEVMILEGQYRKLKTFFRDILFRENRLVFTSGVLKQNHKLLSYISRVHHIDLYNKNTLKTFYKNTLNTLSSQKGFTYSRRFLNIFQKNRKLMVIGSLASAGVYGVKKLFFGKSPTELALDQATFDLPNAEDIRDDLEDFIALNEGRVMASIVRDRDTWTCEHVMALDRFICGNEA